MTVRRPLRTALTVATLPLLVAGLAACSSGGGSSDASGDSPEQQARAWDARYVSCMEDAGFDSDGPFAATSTSADPAELDAGQACWESTVADLGERPVTDAEQKEGDEAQAEYERVTECFAEKGVETPQVDGVMVPPSDVPADIVAACDAEEFYGGSGDDR